jgi:hypothetical protein
MALDELAERDFKGIPAIDLVGVRFRFCSADDEMVGTITGVHNLDRETLGLEVSCQEFLQYKVVRIIPTGSGRADLQLAGLPNGQTHFSGDLQIFR